MLGTCDEAEEDRDRIHFRTAAIPASRDALNPPSLLVSSSIRRSDRLLFEPTLLFTEFPRLPTDRCPRIDEGVEDVETLATDAKRMEEDDEEDVPRLPELEEEAPERFPLPPRLLESELERPSDKGVGAAKGVAGDPSRGEDSG